MDRIKSAFEKAMERAEQLTPPTEEERLEWKWGPEGKKLAGAFMGSKADLAKEVEKVEQPARRYLLKGLIDVLVETLRIPKDEPTFQSNKRNLEALTQLMGAPMKEIAERIRYVWTQYLQFYPQQSQEAFEKLKPMVQSQVEQAVRQQKGTQDPVDLGPIEARPEFQAQWMKVLAQLEEPFESHLREFRQQIRELA